MQISTNLRSTVRPILLLQIPSHDLDRLFTVHSFHLFFLSCSLAIALLLSCSLAILLDLLLLNSLWLLILGFIALRLLSLRLRNLRFLVLGLQDRWELGRGAGSIVVGLGLSGCHVGSTCGSRGEWIEL
jgi:hypothetical protein